MSIDTLVGLVVIKQRTFGSFTFDATLQEVHGHSNTITSQPVELGADLTDHAFSEQPDLLIVGAVSDTPATSNPSFDKGAAGARSSSAFAELLKLKNDHELFSAQTGLLLYNNLLIKDLSARQDARTANTLIVSIHCKQIKQVNIQTTQVPSQFLQQGNTSDNASQTVQQGNKQTTDATTDQTDTANSAFINVFG